MLQSILQNCLKRKGASGLISLMARQMNASGVVIDMRSPKCFACEITFGEALLEHFARGTEAIQWSELTESRWRHFLSLSAPEHSQNRNRVQFWGPIASILECVVSQAGITLSGLSGGTNADLESSAPYGGPAPIWMPSSSSISSPFSSRSGIALREVDYLYQRINKLLR